LLDDERGYADPLSDEAPLLASCYATSIGHRQTVGKRPGAPLQRIGQDPDAPWVEYRGPLQAHLDGFDLHASLTVAAQHSACLPSPPALARARASPEPDAPFDRVA
jgi:hypothetical protein